MPKPMYVWSGSAWVSVATEVESLANFATQSYADNQPGMKLIVPSSVAVGSGTGSVSTSGAVTFSGASSVSLNDVFNSTYDNYRILINATSLTGTMTMRLRVSGADSSAASYKMDLYGTSLWTNSAYSGYQESGSTNFNALAESSPSSISLDMINPFATQKTFLHGQTSQNDRGRSYQGIFDATTSFTGFTILGTSITGTIRVYGYKN